MKRRTFLTQAGAGLATAAIAAPAIAQAAPEIKGVSPPASPRASTRYTARARSSAKRAGKLTSGKFEITPYAADRS
ncbi:MAG: hypothetical protein IPM02_18360 [Betaproteobacteria bacterium]|nr:hypothetical protein [Betaproteobacteria bacterium]